MPAPLNPEVRARIENDIRNGHTRNHIARTHNVSGSTVTKIAKNLEAQGEPPAFDRSSVKTATEARVADLAARRAELAGLLLEDAFRLRDRMWAAQKALVLAAVKGGGQRVEIVERDTEAGEFRNYMTSIGIAIDKVAVLTRDDSEGLAAVDAWLRSVVGA